MSETGSGGCCRCCCSFIFTLGLTSLFMWLSLRTSKPKCSINYFYLSALNKSLNQPNDTTLQFHLRLQNPNKDKGIYYDDVNVTLFDAQNRSRVIGTSVIPGFYQGHQKKATKEGSAPLDKKAVSQAVFPNGSAYFRVDLATAVRFKIIAWKTKRQRIMVGADVEVNSDGTKVRRKDIGLKSPATKSMSCCAVMGLFLNFLVLILLYFW